MKKIKYIGYYDILHDGKQIRSYSLAGAKKMDYICSVLNDIGYEVDIISPSSSIEKGWGWISGSKRSLTSNVNLVNSPSIKEFNIVCRKLKSKISKIWLLFYLLTNCKKNETIIIYHSLGYPLSILFIKKLLSLNIILEIEEIYDMVWKQSAFNKWKEQKFLRSAGKHVLVVSDVLANILSFEKPIISYGNYNTYKGIIMPRRSSSTLNLLYSGSIDKVRYGGFLSVMAMEYLPDNYVLNISGPITYTNKEEFLLLIDYTNNKLKRKAIHYLGVLNDNEYEDLLLKTDIALNPQKEGKFGSYVFPSKILSYLGYNLPVVTTKGDSIIKSSLRDILIFCEEYTPESIAKAILSYDFNSRTIDYRAEVEKLHIKFKTELHNIIKMQI